MKLFGGDNFIRPEDPKARKKQALAWICLPFLGIFLCAFLNLFFEVLGLSETIDTETANSLFGTFDRAQLAMIVVQVILAPLLEEFLFRKLLINFLRKWMRFLFAALISAVLFAALHLNLIQGIYTFLFSLVLVRVLYQTGTWYATLLVHGVHNLFAVFMNFSPGLNEFFLSHSAWLMVGAGLLTAGTYALFEFFTRRE